MNASKDVSVNTAVNFSCVDGTRFVRNHQEYNVFNCLPYDAQLYAQFSPLIEKDSCEVVHCKKINASEYFGDITSSGKQILNDTLNFECYENFKIEKTSDKFGTKYESKCLPDETNDTYILIWLPRLKICEKIECPANTKNASVPHAIVKDNIVFAGESTTYAPERGYFFEDGIEGSFKCIQESINDQRTIYAQ